MRNKALLLLGSVAVLTSAVSACESYNSSKRLVESCKRRDMEVAVAVLQSSILEQSGKAAARAAMIASLTSVKRLLRARDQQGLGSELVPVFLQQRDEFGVREGQFHLPPALSFLRLLGPTKYLEDLSGFREMVVVANRRHEAQRGVEVGRRGLSIRGVAVIEDAAGPIGSFEAAVSFSPVLQAVRQATGAESGVFVEDGLMTRIATLVPRPDEERIVGGYRNVEATDWPVLRPLISPGLLAKADDVSYRWLSAEGVAYGVAAVPLHDFKGQRIGAVIIVRSFELYQRQVWMALVKSVAIAALQAGLLVGALGVALNGLLMRPIGRLSGMLERLAAGDGGVEVGELGKRRDEVGRMARALETLQASLRPRGARPDGEP